MQQHKQCDLNDMVKHQSRGLSGYIDKKKPLLVKTPREENTGIHDLHV